MDTSTCAATSLNSSVQFKSKSNASGCVMKGYVYRVLIGLDQFGNTLLNGAPDETISSRAGRRREKWYWKPVVGFLEWLSPGHCDRAIQTERRRLQLPEELR